MPPKKRQCIEEETPVVSLEIPSNAEKGLLKFPFELRDEVLHHFQGVTIYTEAPYYRQFLGVEFLERTDVLRALSQVSVAYRRVFLPCLWETFMACHGCKSGEEGGQFSAGKPLARKCDGLSRKCNRELAAHVRRAHLIVTRCSRKATGISTKLTFLLTRLPNLHTLHILYAHPFVSKGCTRLPQIRNLIMPGSCHGILKWCPGARSVWCIKEACFKLIDAAKDCKEMEELRGFRSSDKLMKKIVKSVPNLRVYEVLDGSEDVFLRYIAFFEKLDTIIIKPDSRVAKTVRDATIRKCAAAVKSLPPITNKRRIFISHYCVVEWGDGRQLTGDLTEISLLSDIL